jgi:hypothetical protein
MQKSETIGKLVDALIAAQKEFEPILKDKDNPFFKSKYADLAAGIEATQPALTKNGLAVVQFPVSGSPQQQDVTTTDKAEKTVHSSSPVYEIGVVTVLAHSSGEFIAESYTLPLVRQDAQTGVAAVTYARRAAYLAAIGVAAVDDDGNTAAATPERGKSAPIANTAPSGAKRGRPAKTTTLAPSTPKPAAPSSQTEQNKPVTVETTPSVPATAETGPLPIPEEFKTYIDRGRNFANNLKVAGMTPVGTINVKLTKFFQKRAGVTDMKAISKASWESIFGELSALQGQPNGMQGAIDLINKETA